MHMADALLSPAVAVTMYAASAAAAGVSLVQLRREELAASETAKKKLPTMAVMSALVFARQMINYTIPGTGSSGHLCGGMLLSAMLASVAVCCGLLNLFFLRSDRPWSLYVIGAAVMLWIWLVPPLLHRTMPLWLRLLLDVAAVGVYVYLISIDLRGHDWYMGLALPIILTGGAIMAALGLLLGKGRRSILSSVTLIIGSVGLFLVGVEVFIDRWLFGRWTPGWSLVVLAVCAALVIPLLVVRHRPALREEARRRFHM